MIVEYLCKSRYHSRFFKAAASDVAVKHFLNYLRRFTRERPAEVTVEDFDANGKPRDKCTFRVEWYRGPKREGLGEGVVGEWFSLWGPH